MSSCGERFFERTATCTRDSLERLFAQWQASGTPMNGSPAMLAEMFLGLFVSDVHAEAITTFAPVHAHEQSGGHASSLSIFAKPVI